MKNTLRTGVLYIFTLAHSLACFGQSGVQKPDQDPATDKKDYPYVLPVTAAIWC